MYVKKTIQKPNWEPETHRNARPFGSSMVERQRFGCPDTWSCSCKQTLSSFRFPIMAFKRTSINKKLVKFHVECMLESQILCYLKGSKCLKVFIPFYYFLWFLFQWYHSLYFSVGICYSNAAQWPTYSKRDDLAAHRRCHIESIRHKIILKLWHLYKIFSQSAILDIHSI